MANDTELFLRSYKEEDLLEIAELFFNTVHNTANKNYTKLQLNAWASGNIDLKTWNQTLIQNYTIIAEMNKKIVGFGDLAGNYLNRLYVHEKYQGLGIATAITENLEGHAATQGIQVMEVHASITARPFFEYRGFNLVKEQQVLRNGVTLTNFVMKKNL